MSDDGGWGGGDLFLGLLLGGLLLGDRTRSPQTGHHHGQYWHTHDRPPGRHVHDGHPDGPIRIVPPTPEELAAEAQRKAESQDGWGIILYALGILALLAGAGSVGLALMGTATLVSSSMRARLRSSVIEVWEGWAGARATPQRVAESTARSWQPSTSRTIAQPFVTSGVDVGPDGAGRLLVRLLGWCQVTVPAVDVEVVIWRGGDRVGLLTAQLHDLTAGEAREVILTGSEPYTGHDRIKVNSRAVVR